MYYDFIIYANERPTKDSTQTFGRFTWVRAATPETALCLGINQLRNACPAGSLLEGITVYQKSKVDYKVESIARLEVEKQ